MKTMKRSIRNNQANTRRQTAKHDRMRSHLARAGVAAALLSAATADAATLYRLTDLGDLPGGQ